jgi:hypothetical protein
MTPKTTTATAELEALELHVRQAEEPVAATRRQARDVLAPLDAEVKSEQDLWAAGDEAGAEQAAKRRQVLRDETASWQARIAGAELALSRARNARQSFITDNGSAAARTSAGSWYGSRTSSNASSCCTPTTFGP